MKFNQRKCRSCGGGFQPEASCQPFCSDYCRFWSKVEKTDGCWEWQGSFFPSGYGQFNVRRTGMNSHRYAYQSHHKKSIPNGLFACHSCDNKKCCNPSHLFLGTPKDNSLDMVKKGRASKVGNRGNNKGIKKQAGAQDGERNPNSKLTEWDIRFIRHWRDKGHTLQSIGSAFGVSKQMIRAISLRRSWAHVGEYLG